MNPTHYILILQLLFIHTFFVNVILVLVKICLIYAAVCPRLLSTGDFKFIIRVNLIIFLVTLQLKNKKGNVVHVFVPSCEVSFTLM